MELSNPWTEVFTIGHSCQHTRVFTLTACLDDGVAPPVQLDLGELEEKEDENGCDSNGTAEGGREYKVVLRPEAEVVSLEINPRIPANWYSRPYVRYIVRTPLREI